MAELTPNQRYHTLGSIAGSVRRAMKSRQHIMAKYGESADSTHLDALRQRERHLRLAFINLGGDVARLPITDEPPIEVSDA